MKYKKLLYCLLFAPLCNYSQIAGNNTFEFLNLPISARVSALGGNLISTRDNDLNVSLTNPALLTDTMNNNVALSYVNYFADVNYGYAAYAKKIKDIGVFSLGIQHVNYGRFIRTDEIGNIIGGFNGTETSYNISFAHSVIDSNITLGVNLKTIYSHFDNYSSLGSAADIGIVYAKSAKDFALAAVVKNVGYQWKPFVEGNREKLPFEIQIGFSKKPKHIPFRFSITYENLEKWDLTYTDPNNPTPTKDPLTGKPIKVSKFKTGSDKLMRHIVIGGEFILTKNLFLRAGYNYQRRKELKIPEKRGLAGISFGLGLKIYKFHISYARAVYSIAGVSNNFSLSFDINNFYSKKS